MAKDIEIGGRLHSTATGNVVTGANEILDDELNKKQSQINSETLQHVESIDAALQELSPDQTQALALATDVNTLKAKSVRSDETQSLTDAEKELAISNMGVTGVYDISGEHPVSGHPKKYSTLAAALADVPVGRRKSGMSVKALMQLTSEMYHVEVTEGVTDLPTGYNEYELSEASPMTTGDYTYNELDTENFGAIPSTVGASVLYYIYNSQSSSYTTWLLTKSSDSTYAYKQYLYMQEYANTTAGNIAFLTAFNWQGVDDGIIAGSQNLAKSGILNGMVIKVPTFTNGFIDTNDNYHENNDYRCSDYLPLNLVYSIILNDSESLETKVLNLYLYDGEKNLVARSSINFDNINDVLVLNKDTYPQVYIRFWSVTELIQRISLKWIGNKIDELNDDVENLKEVTPEIQGDVLQLKQDFSNLEERLYVDITGNFENGFVDNRGNPHDSDSYSRSKHIKSSDVRRIIIRDDNVTGSQIHLFQTDDWTAPVGKISNLGKDIDLQTAIEQFSNANYFVIWFDESSPSVANEYTDFIPLHLGDIQKLQTNVEDLQEEIENLSVKKSPSGLIYHNSCKFVNDFIAADKGNDYQNLSSSITVVQSGISVPYGAGKWTWVNKNVRNSKKTHIIDFIPNGCTSIKIASFGFHGGANGINENIYFNIDISNNVISCSNGQSANFNFINNGKYRVYLYQEDKHTELTVIDLKSGSKSIVVYYNGTTVNNNGLFYDTWALSPIGASIIITQYEIFAHSKKPFLSIFGDSITLGFNATVSEGLNHNKFAYLVGESTNREYTITGRGGATFAVLYGSTIQGIPNLSSVKFDGMLYSELPAYMPSYVMLTMGTNGGGTYNQYKEFVEYILSLGLIPIVNTLPIRADGQNDKNIPANVAANEAIMQIWKDYNIHGARFDLATSLNNDGETIDQSLYVDDMIHPNDAGHAAMAARVMLDCPELFY